MSECSGADCTHESHSEPRKVGGPQSIVVMPGRQFGKTSAVRHKAEKTEIVSGRVLTNAAAVQKALAAGARVVYVDAKPIAIVKPGRLERMLVALANAGADFGMSKAANRAPNPHTAGKRRKTRGRAGKKTAQRNPARREEILRKRAIRKGRRPPVTS